MLHDIKHDDFEHFLKKNSNEFRLHPTADVWTNISRRLHQRRKRTGFVTGAFFLIASLLGYLMVQIKDVVKPVAVKVIGNTFKSHVPQPLLQERKRDDRTDNVPLIAASRSNFLQSQNVLAKQPGFYTSIKQLVEIDAKINSQDVVVAFAEAFKTAIPDSYSVQDALQEPVATKETAIDLNDNIPTIESVTNAFKPLNKKSKISFQVFFTPTVSYRKLSENKAYLNSVPQTNATINYAVLYNVNDAVTHKPDMGLELGFTAKYPVSKNLKLRGGLQFNISRYDIKAFTYPTEVASIALNNSSLGVNYVGAATNYRNFGGGKANWLQNKYFQLSAPLGAEIKLAGNSKTSFGIAGTLQPTYVLGDRAYMISTDYKNYTEVPWLMRRWNMNTSLETFVTYSTGKISWQVGPQIRYQMLSSFVTEYPVRENLFDFGLKVGVSLNNKSSEK